MKEQTETTSRRGFVSPLQKAQAGKIGGGSDASAPTQEHKNATTFEQQDVVTSETEQSSAKKSKREETHFRQTVWMPKPLNRRLKIHAAKIEDDVSGIINRLVEEYLDREEG